MKYCKKCLNTDTRPGAQFSKDGFCSACLYTASLEDVDWEQRQEILEDLKQFGKASGNNSYDCIIGVSGGKDSTRQAVFVKDVLKMNPLLVCLEYPPDQVTQRGVNNLSNLIKKGFDLVTIYPDPVIWKRLVYKGFFEHGNYLKSCEMALFASVPRFAIAYQIPLIWWGENSALQLGETGVLGETGFDGNNLRNMNTLGGGDITWLLDEEIRRSNLFQHTYPSNEEMKRAKLRIIFLGYFWRDWSTLNNGIYGALHGVDYRDNKPSVTGDMYGITALDDDWHFFNQAIKYLKFGFGRISDDVNEEIRDGNMTRQEGIELMEKYDGVFSEPLILEFCKYLEITYEQFWENIDRFVNKSLFKRVGVGRYDKKFVVGVGLKDS